MTKERFSAILKKYNFSDSQIDDLWASRRTDDINEINEQKLRKTAEKVARDYGLLKKT